MRRLPRPSLISVWSLKMLMPSLISSLQLLSSVQCLPRSHRLPSSLLMCRCHFEQWTALHCLMCPYGPLFIVSVTCLMHEVSSRMCFMADLMLLFRATPRLPAAPGGRSGSCSSTGTAGHVGAPLQEPGGQTGSPAWCPRGRVFGGGYPPRLPACRRGPHLEGGRFL